MDAAMEAIRGDGDGGDDRASIGRIARLSRAWRERFDRIKNNDPDSTELNIEADVADHFSKLTWKMLGRYVANNVLLESINIGTADLSDSTVLAFFGELAGGSRSVRKLVLTKTAFGMGTKCLAQFLKNSRLEVLEIRERERVLDARENGQRVCTECFGLIIDALQGGPVESLCIQGCEKIDSIAALEQYTLPHLRVLNLDHNSIRSIPSLESLSNLERLSLEGNWMRRGYQTVAALLRNQSPPVKSLDLTFTGMGEAQAELIAESLRRNTSLHHLRIEGNKIAEGGRRAFLKLLLDAASIQSTCDSNHTLRSLELPRSFRLEVATTFHYIDLAININKVYAGNLPGAARAKVVKAQLDSHARRELSQLQRVDYCDDGIVPQIEPVLLPHVLATTGRAHGRSALYRVLMAAAPELAGLVDRKTTLRERMADNAARIAAANAEFERDKSALLAEYERRLADLAAGNRRRITALAAENSELTKELESIG